jgi:predicted PurR-regulated permease PerM
VKESALSERNESKGRSTGEIKSLILWAISMVFLAVVIFWCAYLVRGVLLLIYCSILLAIGFSPIVRLIERQTLIPIGSARFPRWLAILILYLAIIGVLTLIGFLVVPPLVHQAQSLWVALPGMFDRAQEFLINKGWMSQHLTLREAVAKTPGTSGDAAGAIAGAVVNVVGGIFGIVTILILTFYLLVESASLRDTFLRLFPKGTRRRAHEAGREVTIKVSAWLGGQLLLGTIIGASSAIGLWALGVPFFYVLALLSGIGELIPVVGPFLSAIPAIAVAATVSLDKVIFVAIFFIIQQQFENHLLVPRIMSKQVGVSAVTVIIALLIGGSLLGILGALLAVPTVAILQVIFFEVVKDD